MSVEEKWRASVKSFEDSVIEVQRIMPDDLAEKPAGTRDAIIARLLIIQNLTAVGLIQLTLDCHKERMERDA